MAMLSLGAVERARRDIRRNVAKLAESVRQGYHIVASEPAAALCLKREYLHVIDDEDARLVAENSSEACSYLWKMHQMGHLELDLKPINATVGYHQPCHVRALQVGDPGENLLGLIPGLSIRKIEQGCSGMAGTYGLKRENYRNSLRAGWGLISAMRHPSIQVGAAECSCCNLQMQQGTTKPTLHPLKLLALAYGLMPEVQQQMGKSSEELIAT
jgi:Fe-S oxidoreductase